MKKRSYELLIANRKYKDTIFRWIFSILENLLSLYNAVTGKNYQNPEDPDAGSGTGTESHDVKYQCRT